MGAFCTSRPPWSSFDHTYRQGKPGDLNANLGSVERPATSYADRKLRPAKLRAAGNEIVCRHVERFRAAVPGSDGLLEDSLAEMAIKDNISLKEACVKLGYLTAADFDRLVKPEAMTRPGV